MFTSYAKCSCGAVTIYEDTGAEYSCRASRKNDFFPGLDLRKLFRYQPMFACNHCVNRYGLDLCGCGSGEPFGKCSNGLPECKMPMQVVGAYSRIPAMDALALQ